MATYYQEPGKIGWNAACFWPWSRRDYTQCVHGEILFQRPSRDRGIWSLPAGAIELGETPAEAVQQEAYEDAGYPDKFLGVFGEAWT